MKKTYAYISVLSDEEPTSVALVREYVTEQGYGDDFSDAKFHNEIYLSDPRKGAPENLKTMIQHLIRKK